MSWVIVVSLSFVLLTVDGGLINELIVFLAAKNQLSAERRMVPAPVYTAGHLEEAGWSTIIYLATITAVDPSCMKRRKWTERDGRGKCGILRARH